MLCCADEQAVATGHEGGMKSGLALPGKKGLCLITSGANGEKNVRKIIKVNPSWSYNWGAKFPDGLPDTIEYAPMIWGGAKSKKDMQDRIDECIMPHLEAGKIHRVLCFNEPDKEDQSNMDPESCLEYWPQLEKLGVPLCSPSCANPLGSKEARECTQGVSGCWMKDFMAKAAERGYRVDYIGVHWYGHPSADGFKKHMREIYEAYGSKRPLIITEFAPADWKARNKSPEDNRFTQEQILKFMKVVLPWLEEQPWIAGYAWFPWKHDSPVGACSALFDAENYLTAVGRYYRSVTPDKPEGDQDISA